jgi:hypothetical protein
MPYIRLQAVNGQDDVSLLLQAGLDALLIPHAQGDQFLIAMHQMRHSALSYAHATRQERLMHFRHTAVVAKPPQPNQRNHLQAKFAVRQRPAPFLLWSIGLMEAWATRLDTTFALQGLTSRGHPSGSRCDGRD